MTSRSSSGCLATRPGRANKLFWLLPGRLVQGHLPAAGQRGHRLQNLLLLTHLQLLGQLAGGGGAAQTLVQLVGSPSEP
jgi:hypothetical protein